MAYQDYKSGERQFDYFVTGMAAAVFAYTAQKYTPHRLTLSFDLLEPAALVTLLASVYFGMKRIEYGVVADRLNFSVLNLAEQRGKALAALAQGGEQLLNTETGQMHNRAELRKLADEREVRRRKDQVQLDDANVRVKRYYLKRNWAFLIGMAVLLLHKLILPYI